jgi:hypothetical protein
MMTNKNPPWLGRTVHVGFEFKAYILHPSNQVKNILVLLATIVVFLLIWLEE